jgi:dihydrofolate reductase
MRKIIASEFYSLDGFISDPKEDMAWVLSDFSEDMGEYEDDIYKKADTLLLGRKTYRIFEGYWPAAAENPSTPAEDAGMAHTMNKIKKIVFSKTIKEVTWQNSYLKKEIDQDEINNMKKEEGKNMLVIGSSEIVQQFSRLGLIDEYHLLVHPVILGEGIPLFNNLKEMQKLKLFGSKQFSNGVVGLFYHRLKD